MRTSAALAARAIRLKCRRRIVAKERIMQIAKWAARIGAAFYVLWGVFHLVAANEVYALAQQSTGMVRGRLLQDAFYVLFFAAAGIVLAVVLNWRNDKQGYWMKW